MTYPFDTTTTDDLTDAQKQAAIAACKGAYPNAIIALARLMRDHPELFEEPVDPAVLTVREAMARRFREYDANYTADQCVAGKLDGSPGFLAALDLLRTAKGGAA